MGCLGHVSDYVQFCLRRIWFMIAIVTAFNLGAPVPAEGCGSGGNCGDDSPPTLDRLLWLSLSRSSSDSPHGTAEAETMMVATPSPLAAQPVVIPLPAPDQRAVDQSPQYEMSPKAGHELVLELVLELVPGTMEDGGDAVLTLHGFVPVDAPAQDHSPDFHPDNILIMRAFQLPQQDGLPPDLASHVLGGLPHGAVSAPVTMQMICGACAADRGLHRFSGKAVLRFDPHDPAPSLIDDIRLQSQTGIRASGRLSFADQGAATDGLLTDPDGRLDLIVDGEALRFVADVALWHQTKGMQGGFAAISPPDLPDIGGIIGYFSEDR